MFKQNNLKLTTSMIFLPFFIVFVFSGCWDKNTGPCCSPIGYVTNHSGCKEASGGSHNGTFTAVQDCLHYQYDGKSMLRMQHINTAFNCCPGAIQIDLRVDDEDHIIYIEEVEREAGCNCLCLFDIESEVRNLQPGHYTIVLLQMYLPDQAETFHFSVNLTMQTSGYECIERSGYPWI